MKRVPIELEEKETKEINNEVSELLFLFFNTIKNLLQIAVLKTLNHPNVVKYYESFIHNGKLCIVMDFAENGNLFKILATFSVFLLILFFIGDLQRKIKEAKA